MAIRLHKPKPSKFYSVANGDTRVITGVPVAYQKGKDKYTVGVISESGLHIIQLWDVHEIFIEG